MIIIILRLETEWNNASAHRADVIVPLNISGLNEPDVFTD